MVGALWTGISGLASHQSALDNESHNIANVNTVGYKASRISFADQMYQDKIGKGSKVLDAEKLFTQGSMKPTGVSYDMALSGDGFFAVSNTRASGTSETFYTRSGNFRMGDNGTLQDAAGNEVQGWAMLPIDYDKDVISTNPNVNKFTTDYTSTVTSKVIKYASSVQTVTAKTTDYSQTVKGDSETVFSGSGMKSQQAKVADIQKLTENYKTQLQRLSEDPNGVSSTSTSQVTYIDFENNVANGPLTKEGHQVYVHINGEKYSESFDGSYENTMKKLADRISSIPGFKAYMSNNGTQETDSEGISTNNTTNDVVNPWEMSTDDVVVSKGVLRIESLVPGESFTVGELGINLSTTSTVLGKTIAVTEAGSDAIQGTGMGAVESAKEALAEVVSGKQRDVYTPGQLEFDTANGSNFTYAVTVYDKETKQNISIPSSGAESFFTFNNMKTVDDIMAKLNGDAEFSKHLEAVKVNGNLVIQSLDANYDVEFNSFLNKEPKQESYVSVVNPTSASTATFTGPTFDGKKDYQLQFTIDGVKYPAGAPLTLNNNADLNSTLATITALHPDVTATNAGGNLVLTIATGKEFEDISLVEVGDQLYTGNAGPSNLYSSQTSASTGSPATQVNEALGSVTPSGNDDFYFKFDVNGTIVPSTDSIKISTPADVDAIVTALNANSDFSTHLTAANNAGTLEITSNALPDNTTFDYSVISAPPSSAVPATSSAQAYATYPNVGANGNDDFDFSFNVNGTVVPTTGSITITNAQDIKTIAANLNANTEFSAHLMASVDPTTGALRVESKSLGDLQTFTATIDVDYHPTSLIDVNPDYSGREGAGAEFLEMKTTIDQTASKGSLQLRLDTLGISGSAFGDFDVDDTGLITMTQDGATFAIGQVAIARFNNNRALEPTGDNLYKATAQSGDAIFNINNDKTAKVEGKTLELSTADLSESLVNLMVFQRAFEANAKSITTSDQLLNTLINLKR